MIASVSHVLIVDSSQGERKIIRQLLRAAPGGYIVMEADRGERAIAICQTTRPDCVLLDHHLPDRGCMELLATLHALGDMPTIVMAPNELALQGGRERYLAAGAMAYLSKPVNLISLVATVTQVLAVTALKSETLF